MRPPPMLTLRCRPSRAWRVLCAALGAAAGASLAAWVAGHLHWLPLETQVAVITGALVGVLSGLGGAGAMRPVRLHWDGQAWHLDDLRGDLRVMLDLDRWLLLRLRAEGARATRWVALSRAQRSGEWRALRTALYSRPPVATRVTPAPSRVRPADRARH